jgi:hypothetical protein
MLQLKNHLINFKKKITSKLTFNIDNKNKLETFEFVSIKDLNQNQKNLKSFLKSQNCWITMFDDCSVSLTEPKFLFKSKYNNKFLNERNNGLSIVNLKKKIKLTGSILANLNNIKIINGTLLILKNNNIALVEGYGDYRWANFQMNKWPDAHNYPMGRINFYKKKTIYKRVKTYYIKKKIKIINEPAIFLSIRKEDDQVFHWTFENLTRLYCLDIIPQLKKYSLILKDPLSKFQKETLKLMGIKNKFIYAGENDLIVKKLFYPSIPSPSILNEKLILWLRKKLLSNAIKKLAKKKLNFNKRVFISRNDTGHRKIVNEKDLFQELKKKNFSLYKLSELSLEEQILLFNNAEIVIMSHGAGGIHTLFSSKKTSIIEIQSPLQPNNIFYCISTILGIKHIISFGCDPINDYKKNYYINVKLFIKNFEEKFGKF